MAGQEEMTVYLSLGYASEGRIHLADPGSKQAVPIRVSKIAAWETFTRACCAALQVWRVNVAVYNARGEMVAQRSLNVP
jgi:hypothetical protein